MGKGRTQASSSVGALVLVGAERDRAVWGCPAGSPRVAARKTWLVWVSESLPVREIVEVAGKGSVLLSEAAF